MLGNGVVGILSESTNKWERRVPLTPSHCARLLCGGTGKTGVARIIVQPSKKRIYHDALYEDVGCEISEDLSECGLIVGVKQPKLEMILLDKAYAFFSHTHKAQKENMPLLDKVLAERATLFDYELIAGDDGKRLLAFGKFAGRAGMIDFFGLLGQRFLSLGYSTPFISLGASYMYSSLAAAKSAVISVGEEIATMGLPSGICPLVFVFTGDGNVSQGAREIFKLLPHSFVDPSKLPELFEKARDANHVGQSSKRAFQVYGCVVTSKDMVEPKDPSKTFHKADYYAHPENYRPVFHEKIAPFTSVLVNCMYWEKRYPRLLTSKQLQELMMNGCPLIGIADITCDICGSLEFMDRTTSIDSPFIRYDPKDNSYHHNMDGDGVVCSAVDILPTEFAREASQHFGDILSQFIGSLASSKLLDTLPPHLKRACIVHTGSLTSLYEYIPRMRLSGAEDLSETLPPSKPENMKYTTLVSLSGHLFDQFLINEALDIIESAGGSFHLVKCQLGQSTNTMSYSELEIGADDKAVLDKIIDSLTSLSHPTSPRLLDNKKHMISLKVGKFLDGTDSERRTCDTKIDASVLVLGAGRVCRPAVEFLTSSKQRLSCLVENDSKEMSCVHVIVASLYLKDAKEVTEGFPNAKAVELDISNKDNLSKYVSQVDVVISLLPPSCHSTIASVCLEFKKHLVTASYVDDSMSEFDEAAKRSGVTILCEMGLDPGIDHMLAMKMINEAHARGGKIKSFTSYCGGLPSPNAANNPLAYKFSWSPAGAIRAGRNPAKYKYNSDIVNVDGDKLYDSAVRFRVPDFPAFAFECLPNRNSLIYGELYGIENEASTIFRGTLRYEGFGEIMGTMARIGFFDTDESEILKNKARPIYRAFLLSLLQLDSQDSAKEIIGENVITDQITALNFCTDKQTAIKTAKTIMFLGFLEKTEIPLSCKCPFDVTCLRMEERMAYSEKELDMVILHHEVEVEFPNDQPCENHRATLLDFGRGQYTAMALTVGIPAAIGALLILSKSVKSYGVLRPMDPEIYVPALKILEAYGFNLVEKID